MQSKSVLILQARPEDAAADGEFAAILDKGGLSPEEVHRVRLEAASPPTPEDLSNYKAIILGGGPGCVSDAPETKKPVIRKRCKTCLKAAYIWLLRKPVLSR